MMTLVADKVGGGKGGRGEEDAVVIEGGIEITMAIMTKTILTV